MKDNGIFLGTDSGATTSKTGGICADGTIISHQLRQSATNSAAGTEAVIRGWIEGANGFLAENHLSWSHVRGVGLAIPGPYDSYGVMGRAANLPRSFEGWNFHADYGRALAQAAGRAIQLVVGNDGNFGGVAEAHTARAGRKAGVLMFAPGSGLGCAYVDPNGLPLDGDTLSGIAYFASQRRQTGLYAYLSNLHSIYLNTHVSIRRRIDLLAGLSRVEDTAGNGAGPFYQAASRPFFYSAETFPMAFTSPMARLSVKLHPKVRWNVAYQYYGYRQSFVTRIIPSQGYRAHTGYTSLLWAF